MTGTVRQYGRLSDYEISEDVMHFPRWSKSVFQERHSFSASIFMITSVLIRSAYVLLFNLLSCFYFWMFTFIAILYQYMSVFDRLETLCRVDLQSKTSFEAKFSTYISFITDQLEICWVSNSIATSCVFFLSAVVVVLTWNRERDVWKSKNCPRTPQALEVHGLPLSH